MEIYVQSCGFAQEDDYRWLRIELQSQEPEEPPTDLVSADLINSEALSLVLGRLPDERLLLLLTGIKSEGRRDAWNRPILIAVAWVGRDSDEPLLRRLAARALNEKELHSLTKEISHAVTPGGSYGFKVSFQDILGLVSAVPAKELPRNEPPDSKQRIERATPAHKKAFAEELNRCRLPKQKGPLVVFAEAQDKAVLEKTGVWRGLSSIVGAQEQGKRADSLSWEDLKKFAETQKQVDICILIDSSGSMNKIAEAPSADNWTYLQEKVGEHLKNIWSRYNTLGEYFCPGCALMFFNSYDRQPKISELSSNLPEIKHKYSQRLAEIFEVNKPEQASYIYPALTKAINDCYTGCENGSNMGFVIIYTDGQLVDIIEAANKMAETCRKLNEDYQLKILMLGKGINKTSLVDPTFYLNLAAEKDRFKHGTDSNIFGFDLLEEIEQLPNGIIDFLQRQFEIHLQDRLPPWVKERYPEWYRQRFGA